MNKNEDYIICGYPPSDGGVGRLMRYLVKHNHENFCILYPKEFYPKIELRTLLKKKLYPLFLKQFLKNKYSKIVNKSIFNMSIRRLKSKNIILIHPQTIGIKNVIRLIKNNRCYIYIMDCSFFCVKSYNHIEGSFNPCLLCIGGNYKFAERHNCKPTPVKYKLNENIKFFKKLMALSKNITFIIQTTSHAELVKKHFGNDVKVYKVGIFTDDFIDTINKHRNVKETNSKFNVDFVYHGAAIEAKGLLYVINIASKLKQYSFLVPAPYESCKKILGDKIEEKDVKNILFEDIHWESSLKEYVINSKVVLCPSLWSASIEGALIKSFIFNGVVASVPSKYSFVSDIPKNIYCELNSTDLNETIKVLTELIDNNKLRSNLRSESQKWVKTYLNENRSIVKKLKMVLKYE